MRKINRSSEPVSQGHVKGTSRGSRRHSPESVGSILRRMDLPVQLAPQRPNERRERPVLNKRGFGKGNILVRNIERLERRTDDE